MNERVQSSGGRNLIVGFLAGGIIGAAIALLYAPMKGERLRAKIRRKSEDLMEEAQDVLEDVTERASDTLNHVKREGERALGDVRKRAAAVTERATEILREN
jgi:gas vesicle protein